MMAERAEGATMAEEREEREVGEREAAVAAKREVGEEKGTPPHTGSSCRSLSHRTLRMHTHTPMSVCIESHAAWRRGGC